MTPSVLYCGAYPAEPVTAAKFPLSDDAPLMILNVSVGLGVKPVESMESVPSSETEPLTTIRSNCPTAAPAISSASVPLAPWV